jgi:hypothetical protein
MVRFLPLMANREFKPAGPGVSGRSGAVGALDRTHHVWPVPSWLGLLDQLAWRLLAHWLPSRPGRARAQD